MKAKRIPVTGLVHLLANSFEEVIMSPIYFYVNLLLCTADCISTIVSQ